MAEAKYQPVLAEKDRENRAVITENQAIKREIEVKDRENEWLRRKLQEAGVDPRQGHGSFE
jgi:hypothetical protein